MRPGFPCPPVSATQAPGPHHEEGCTSAAKAVAWGLNYKSRFINGIEGWRRLAGRERIVLSFLSQIDTMSQARH